jgi:hypothetical protein
MPPAGQAMQPKPAAPQQAPFGTTSATQPTSNRGSEAAAIQQVAAAVKSLSNAFGLAGATSELGQEIMKVLPRLSKLVPPGSSTPASEKNVLQQQAMKNAQANQGAMAMRAGMQGGGQRPQAPQMPPQAAGMAA